MRMAINKTVWMCAGSDGQQNSKMNSFTYLGLQINADGAAIFRAKQYLERLQPILKYPKLSVQVKARLIEILAETIL